MVTSVRASWIYPVARQLSWCGFQSRQKVGSWGKAAPRAPLRAPRPTTSVGAAEAGLDLIGERCRSEPAGVGVSAGPDPGSRTPRRRASPSFSRTWADVEARSSHVGEAAGDRHPVAMGTGRAERGAGRHQRPAEDAEFRRRRRQRPPRGLDQHQWRRRRRRSTAG